MSPAIVTPTSAVGYQWITGTVNSTYMVQYHPIWTDTESGTYYSFRFDDNNRYVIHDSLGGFDFYIYTRVLDTGLSKRVMVSFDRNDFHMPGHGIPGGGGVSVEVKNYNTGTYVQKAYCDVQGPWSVTFMLYSGQYQSLGGYVETIILLRAWTLDAAYELHIDRAVIQTMSPDTPF